MGRSCILSPTMAAASTSDPPTVSFSLFSGSIQGRNFLVTGSDSPPCGGLFRGTEGKCGRGEQWKRELLFISRWDLLRAAWRVPTNFASSVSNSENSFQVHYFGRQS